MRVQYKELFVFPQQKLLHAHVSVLHYMYFACCIILCALLSNGVTCWDNVVDKASLYFTKHIHITVLLIGEISIYKG